MEAQGNNNSLIEKVEIGGKKYLRSGSSYSALAELKKPGSFINILANSLSAAGMGPGQKITYWR